MCKGGARARGGRSESHHFLAKIFVATDDRWPPGEFCCGLWRMVRKCHPPILVVKKPCLTALHVILYVAQHLSQYNAIKLQKISTLHSTNYGHSMAHTESVTYSTERDLSGVRPRCATLYLGRGSEPFALANGREW